MNGLDVNDAGSFSHGNTVHQPPHWEEPVSFTTLKSADDAMHDYINDKEAEVGPLDDAFSVASASPRIPMSSASSDSESSVSGDDEDFENASVASEIRQQAERVDRLEKERMVDRIKRFAKTHDLKARMANADWSADDLQVEIMRLSKEASLVRSLKFQRRVLLTATSGMEYVHTKTPLAGKLDGWGESILSTIDEFDPVFERLHEKHAPKMSLGSEGGEEEPELQLLRMLFYSAFTHGLSVSIAKLTAEGVKDARGARDRMDSGRDDTAKFVAASEGGSSSRRTINLN